MKKKLLMMMAGLSAAALAETTLLEENFTSPDALKRFHISECRPQVQNNALTIPLPERPQTPGVVGLHKRFDPRILAGRRLKISAEIRGKEVAPARREWNGAKFMLNTKAAKAPEAWTQARLKQGTFDWEKITFSADTPFSLTHAALSIGFQDSFGTLEVRNLKVEVQDTFLNFEDAATMGLTDQVENDGKGGWSDQGPANDGSRFNFKQKLFGNVPFLPVDPARNNDKAVITFKSAKFPQGIEEVTFDLSHQNVSANYLYLLHTSCWGQTSGTIGTVTVTGRNGKTQTIPVKNGRDIADWWTPRQLPNGHVGATWTTEAGGRVGMYVSRYKLDGNLGDLKSITVRSAGSSSVWIVAGITLSDQEYKFPGMQRYTTKADDKWKPVPRGKSPTIVPGSALDVSSILPSGKAGDSGRVIINSSGKLAFEKKPEQAVRFLSDCVATDAFQGRRQTGPAQLTSHEAIAEYVQELKRNGYNMLRTHFLDYILMRGSTEDCRFNETALDRFEYLVYQMKENGIYLNFDAMTSWTGYTPANPWAPDLDNLKQFKHLIHFDDAVRKNWETGVTKLLTRVNPYTKTRLVDDPVLALIVGFNEQEFAFIKEFDPAPALPHWRNFLKQRYGTIEKLRTAWGKDAANINSFNDIAAFQRHEIPLQTPKGGDIGRFIYETEIKTFNFYRSVLNKIGCKAPLSGFNCGKDFHYQAVRNALDFVSMNSYHAHPSNYMNPGSTIMQDSSIAGAGSVFRWALGGRMVHKPFVITEHANAFWNRYRYEQSFVTGAYGAFQNVDVLTNFASLIGVEFSTRIHPFLTVHDPILRSSEFLTFFMFRRGDVKGADSQVRIVSDFEEVYRKFQQNNTIASAQSKLCLVTGFALEMKGSGPEIPLAEREIAIPRLGGAGVHSDTAGFSSVTGDLADALFDGDKMIRDLKARNLIPAANRTSMSNNFYESSTGELVMDVRNHFGRVKTPNLQAIYAEKGASTDLGNLKINEMTIKGNLGLVSVDGRKKLDEARRMVLVYATDALNSQMVFDDPERLTLRDIGTGPVLVECGKFNVTIRNRNAAKLKAYALDMSGNRLTEIKPFKVNEKEVTFICDTATLPAGPSLYYEIIKE